ncbi:hypothetical protein ON010_g3306 [Phytophthora cinnamomi]|nr:hypothetical protein ON010_g3306 [Phytophthora cinnamomi]
MMRICFVDTKTGMLDLRFPSGTAASQRRGGTWQSAQYREGMAISKNPSRSSLRHDHDGAQHHGRHVRLWARADSSRLRSDAGDLRHQRVSALPDRLLRRGLRDARHERRHVLPSGQVRRLAAAALHVPTLLLCVTHDDHPGRGPRELWSHRPAPGRSFPLGLVHSFALLGVRGAAMIHKPTHLKCLEYTTIAFVWAFYTAYDMSLFAFKGFIPPTLNYIQLGVSASVLGLIALTFLIYGLRVMVRLQEYERQLKLRLPSFDSDYDISNHSFELNVSDSEDDTPVAQEHRFAPCRPQEGHTAKIKRILLVAEAVSIVVIAGQVYMVTQVSNAPVELACANGRLCSTVKSKWSLLHVFQVVAVWAMLYVFRDVQKKSVIPHPRGSTGY